ncbi:unnamed protein product [Allacma fusca]|uniref:Uncharacterized protein n=1 Tax=Allacma fusca TaxID=39272 RepID=A0A8J2PJH4_9HEXA|nr:unnamed protein product [Allacma fusca]
MSPPFNVLKICWLFHMIDRFPVRAVGSSLRAAIIVVIRICTLRILVLAATVQDLLEFTTVVFTWVKRAILG